MSSIARPVTAAKTSAPEAPNTKYPRSTSMPNAHVTVQPKGQAIATTGGHSLARRSRPRKEPPLQQSYRDAGSQASDEQGSYPRSCTREQRPEGVADRHAQGGC